MDELFRLTVVRAADSTDALTVSLHLSKQLEIELSGGQSWRGRVEIAEQYLDGNLEPNVPPLMRLTELDLYTQLQAFLGALQANPQTTGRDALQKLASGLIDAPELDTTHIRLSDNFLALYIAPHRDRPSLLKIAELLRLTWFLLLIRDTDPTDPTLDDPSIITKALSATILMPPPRLFGILTTWVFPVGVADLLLVKQHISGYELGEVARIENILKGETRTHTQKHSLVNERDTTIETTTEKVKEQELTTKDTINLRNEVQNTLNEQLHLGGSVSFTYDGSPYHLESNVNFAYDKSSSQASKSAQELSKDVVQKTASKLTERIQQIIVTKITETLEDTENQEYNNSTGPEHISGVYQWVEKVYTAQVFNYGKRLLLDLMVPEPGAYLLQLAQPPAPNAQTPAAPPPLTLHGWPSGKIPQGQTDPPLQPFDLSESDVILEQGTNKPVLDSKGNPIPNPGFYGNFVARYEAPDVEPPPPYTITVTKAIATREQTGGSDITISDTLRIDDGYAAESVTVTADWRHRAGDENPAILDIIVGKQNFHFTEKRENTHGKDEFGQTLSIADPAQWGEQESIAVSVKTAVITVIATNIEMTCNRTKTLFAKWQLETYGKIAARYQRLQEDYDSAQKAQQLEQKIGPLGRDPATNRLTERTELKRSCIAIMRHVPMRGLNDIIPPSDPSVLPTASGFVAAPGPDLERSQEDGAIARFFEQAFEWDKIGYVCYPYYWGRQTQWPTTAPLANDDPLFEAFLRAGYARVVIPVRPAFSDAVMYFLTTRQVWQGGSLPAVAHPPYLPITEEIKDQTGAPGNELPKGDPWTYRLPATLIRLRKDDQLPSWIWDKHQPAPPDNWTWIDSTGKPPQKG